MMKAESDSNPGCKLLSSPRSARTYWSAMRRWQNSDFGPAQNPNRVAITVNIPEYRFSYRVLIISNGSPQICNTGFDKASTYNPPLPTLISRIDPADDLQSIPSIRSFQSLHSGTLLHEVR